MPELASDAGPAHSGVLWLTGYSGAGKTTVARKVERELRRRGEQVVFFDGDDLRSIFARRWGYERDERVELAHVYFRLSSHLAAQGFVVVIAAVAMYDEVRAWVRQNIPDSFVAYLDVPHDVRVARDAGTKRVYSSGVDLEQAYDEPIDPDLRVANFGEVDADDAARQVVEGFLGRGRVLAPDRGKSGHWERYYATQRTVPDPSPFAVEVEPRFERHSKVLEIGCGNGRDAAHLAASGHHVVGLDLSQAAIDLCRTAHEGLSAEFVAGSLPEHSADWGGAFDGLYSRFVIHAMTEAEEVAMWAAAHHVLRPGAQLAVECRSINDPLARKGEVLSPTERIDGHYRRFIVADELRDRLGDAGFEIVALRESAGLAVHGDEDPVVIRVHARRG